METTQLSVLPCFALASPPTPHHERIHKRWWQCGRTKKVNKGRHSTNKDFPRGQVNGFGTTWTLKTNNVGQMINEIGEPSESNKYFQEKHFTIMEKKKRDYIFLLSFMILSFITITPLTKISSPESNLQILLSGITIVLWYIFCYRVTSNFYVSKWIRGAYAFLLIFQLTFNSYVNLKTNTDISTLVVPASIGYIANLIGFSWVFYILLRDIFSQKHDLTYSLLGASNIYFMIPMLFCYLYSLVAVHNPAIVNADPLAIKTLLFKCMDYSWYILAGIDYPGEKIGEELQSIAILESISANLFIVFIIGRLMSK